MKSKQIIKVKSLNKKLNYEILDCRYRLKLEDQQTKKSYYIFDNL